MERRLKFDKVLPVAHDQLSFSEAVFINTILHGTTFFCLFHGLRSRVEADVGKSVL
jgi:hypothetical protein